jgi:hypothetical protein
MVMHKENETLFIREESLVLNSFISAATAASQPAGGAALDQVAIATVGAMVASGVLLYLVIGHRWGRVPYLGRLADFSERISGLPGWAALPLGVAGGTLIIALFGMYWDISLHIDQGRDPGPLANPAHYFILVGLFGIFTAGVLAIGLPVDEKPGPAAVRVSEGWYAPVGGVLIAVCGAFSLIAFPLDDFWHRLFGQDVTLWGPTHLMLIGGAGMTLVGQAILLSEGMSARKAKTGDDAPPPMSGLSPSLVVSIRRIALLGAFLIGLSTFQAEFDFGVPQFDQMFQPMMIALAAGVALTAARVWVGPGGALAAVVFYFLVRGTVSILVGPVLGQTTPAVPLYFVEAGCVELAGLFLARRPLALGAVGGLLIGTVGFASEYGWTNLVYRLPWNDTLLPEGVIVAVLAGVSGGLVGALLAMGLRRELPGQTISRVIPAAALGVIGILLIYGLGTTVPSHTTASVTLTEAASKPGERQVNAVVRLHPADLADDAHWITATAWQGGGLQVERLKRVSEGVYRTTDPVPVYGDWKTTLRVHRNRQIIAVPIYLPRDTAIPAKEIPASAHFTRTFIDDKQLLQREKKKDIPGWLWTAAVLFVMSLYVVFLGALAWGVGRVARRDPREGGPGRPEGVKPQPPLTAPPATPAQA